MGFNIGWSLACASILLVAVSSFTAASYEHGAVSRFDDSRKKAEEWFLKNKDSQSGWLGDTHRGLIALYLSNHSIVRNEDCEMKLTTRQMELQLAVQLEKNCQDYGTSAALSIGQLALFVQALIAVGLKPNSFYGRDLTKCINQPLRQQPSDFAYALTALAFCNSGGIVTEEHIAKLLVILQNRKQILADTPAMAALAVICAEKNSPAAQTDEVRKQLKQTLDTFKASQLPDGSISKNVDTTALVVQALVAAKDFGNAWDYEKAMNYLIDSQSEDGAFGGNFLTNYEALPLLSNHTFVDIGELN